MRHKRSYKVIEWIVGAIIAIVLGFFAFGEADDDDYDDDDCFQTCQVEEYDD